MKKKYFILLILLLVIAIAAVNIWNFQQNQATNEDKSESTGDSKIIPYDEQPSVEKGNPAPDFTLTTLDGKEVKLSDYLGKKVILNFWATWCPPCKAEMPHMQNFYEKNKDKGIEILAVNLTSQDKGMEKIEEFVQEYGLSFPIPLDKDGEIGVLYQAFGIPTSYIIDSNGIITERIPGPMDEEMMENLTKNIE